MIDSINWSDSRKHRPEATRQIERGTSRKAIDTRWPRGEGGSQTVRQIFTSFQRLAILLLVFPSFFLSLSLQHALPLVTQLRLSRGRLPVAEKMKKQKNLQEQYLVRKGEGKRKKKQQVSKKLQNLKREKRFSPDTFDINTLALFSLQNATVFTSSRQESVGQRLQCLSLEAECVCVCALCRRFLARETTTHT